MSRKSKMQSVREAKDRRMKKIAVGGVILLAAVLAFEIPKVMKSGGGTSSTPPAATTTTAAGTGAPAAPATTAPGTAAAAVLPTASTKLTNSDVAPSRTKSQLSSFDTFAGKDPFVQQVSQNAAAGTSPASPAAQHHSSAPTSSAGGGTSAQQTSARTLAAGGVATIQVNGKSETVRVGASFPSANPVFTLVSVTHGTANIGIADGSYSSGAQTVRLSGNRPLTLVDTADGVRYKLSLLSAS